MTFSQCVHGVYDEKMSLYINNPAEMTRFEKIPRVHKYRKVGNYYEKTD